MRTDAATVDGSASGMRYNERGPLGIIMAAESLSRRFSSRRLLMPASQQVGPASCYANQPHRLTTGAFAGSSVAAERCLATWRRG